MANLIDNFTYDPQDSFHVKNGELSDIIVTPKQNIVQPKLNEQEWQDYWGNEGASSVNQTMNRAGKEIAPYLLTAVTAPGAGKAVESFAGSEIGGRIGEAISGKVGNLLGSQIGGNIISKTSKILSKLLKDGGNVNKKKLVRKKFNNLYK